jgi:hypothetical protein
MFRKFLMLLSLIFWLGCFEVHGTSDTTEPLLSKEKWEAYARFSGLVRGTEGGGSGGAGSATTSTTAAVASNDRIASLEEFRKHIKSYL